MEAPAPVILNRKRTFLSTLALGVSLLGVTVVLCGTAVIVYGMNIADRKADGLLGAAGDLLRGLPEARKSLPPALADILDDARRPDYAREIEVTARISGRRTDDRSFTAVIDVRNNGAELVTLLSLRVVILGEDGGPVAEWNEWAATPFAADDDWKGPLIPGSTRRMAARPRHISRVIPAEGLRVEVEVSDIRVWKGEGAAARERQV
jgi:hypothetical protein